MKLFWEFLKKVFLNFVSALTGTILAFYYIFVEKRIEDQPFASDVYVAVLALGFISACFYAWRELRMENEVYKQRITELEDVRPKYVIRMVELADVIKQMASGIDDEILDAEKSREAAIDRSTFYQSITLHGQPTKTDWSRYIDELKAYKKHLQKISSSEKYKIINFTIENVGHSDNNINVHIRFSGIKQELHYFTDNIEIERPHRPTSLLSLVPNLNKRELGFRREVHVNEEDEVEVEINRLHKGEKANLLFNPLFLIPVISEVYRIEYSVKSDNYNDTGYKQI